MSGNYSIQVISEGLERQGLTTTNIDSADVRRTMTDPCEETGFICNSSEHWFSIRKVGRSWYNLNSLADGPKLVSDFYLSALLESVKVEGFVIFVVRGDYPTLTREQFGSFQDNQMWFPSSMFALPSATEQPDELARAIEESLNSIDDQGDFQRAIEESLMATSTPPLQDFGEIEAEAEGPDVFELRVRIWDGTTHLRKFNPNDPLSKVKDWIQATTKQHVRLMNTYPMQELTSFESHLADLGLNRSNNLLRGERAL